VDADRVYLSGLSMGGIVSSDVGAAYPDQIAAIAPMAGVFFQNVPAKCEILAKENVPVWAFHNENDPQINIIIPQYFVSEIKRFNPVVPPRLTIFRAYGHDAWADALNPDYKEDGKNVYEWMLQFSK
jgi:poly(3-hydroxybutyrate) depolymerase